MRGRVLVIDHATPTPDRDSGSASAFLMLRILVRAGFRVTFAPMNLSHDGSYSDALIRLGVTVLARPRWTSLRHVVDELGSQMDVMILSRAPVASRVFEQIRHVAPATMVLFDTVDLHFLRMEREAVLTGSTADAEEASDMRSVELDLIRRADAAAVVSSYEQDLLRSLLPRARVHRIPVMREAPVRSALPFDARRDIVFVGSYGHRPNVDGVLWFAKEVWPLVLRKGVSARFGVVGPDVPPEISSLASDTIEIRGHVPDLATVFDSCRMSVAPLRYGGGVKGKIVSSFSYGVPVVATAIAAEGMDLQSGRNILIGDTPDDFADQVARLYADESLWQQLSRNGHAVFEKRSSESAGEQLIVPLLDRLVARSRRKAARLRFSNFIRSRFLRARPTSADHPG